jgi:hypothetical protein
MKTRFLWLASVVLPLLVGCANANSETEKANTNVVMQPAPASVAAPAATNPVPEAIVPAGQPVNTEVAPPSNIKLSPAATEITKLVQAGVDSSVIMAYVTNSRNTFRLEADEIVYLKDIGMSPEVVTAMIQQDQRLRNQTITGPEPTTAAATSVWSAGQVAPSSNIWQQEASEPAPAAQPSTATTVPPPPPDETPASETVNYFYDSLAPYGTWIDVEGYGRCWRPTVVVTTPGWRPYSHAGRWMWTDSGWYWYSDYSWGWAPFHYGRWYSHPRWGWCWMPGSVWGPSWVSWRYSDGYCGWAPLPPAAYYSPSIGFSYYGSSCGSSFSFGLTWDCFTFVSYNNFHRHRYDRDCVPHHQAGHVYNNTTVVNNIIRGNNNTIINQGIPPTRITAASGTPIQQVTIRDGRGPRNGRVTRNEAIAQDGKTLQVIRTDVPAGHPHGNIRTSGNIRGGAQGLTTGNAAAPAPAAATVSQTGLVPPRTGGPRNTVPPRNLSPLQGNTPTVVSAPTPPQSTTASPAAPSANAAAGSITPPIRGHESAPANANIRHQNNPGSLIIRTPQTPAAQNNNIASPGNAPAPMVATPAPAPVAPAVAPTPSASGNVRSHATPWINNTPTQTPSQPAGGQSGGIRSAPIRQDVRTPKNNDHIQPQTPRYVAPTPAPSYQAPVPPRSYSAPAPPQVSQPVQSYTPPTRNVETRSTPAPSQPSYSPPPPRQSSAPSYSPPPPSRSEPRSEPRSESRSESRGSSGSSNSRDDRSDRSSRGR